MFEVPQAKRIKREDLFRHDDSPASSRPSSRSSSPNDRDDVETGDPVRPNYGFEYDFITPQPEQQQQQQQRPKKKHGADHRQAQDDAAEPKDNRHDDGDEDHQQEAEAEAEPEYQFRLFTSAAPPTTQPSSQPKKATIRLSATPPPEEFFPESTTALSLETAGFVRPNRRDDYYFTSSLPADVTKTLKSQYADTALSTSDVLARAGSTRWPGTALPWRCIHVTTTTTTTLKVGSNPKGTTVVDTSSFSSSRAGPSSCHGIDSKRKGPSASAAATASIVVQRPRPRPSKKRRILNRRRLALRAEMASKAEKAEELERQKRTRRNREKKVKRKEREKLKKQLEQKQEEQGSDEKTR